ncbi:hypothetical protein OS493_034021 [Desmophyllum pertusum]|uniref:Uncharacterized protein n=1 Tax=Desmophyllum pertusum TaxID=174260 RepID=A0A9W9Z816_9CNID|nr:hypothetical protein OS493_034021 [Desmophyllum pertusum]
MVAVQFDQMKRKNELLEEKSSQLENDVGPVQKAVITRDKMLTDAKKLKEEMAATIETLEQENEHLHHKLNSGVVGKYRAVKRFFGRLVDALRSL